MLAHVGNGLINGVNSDSAMVEMMREMMAPYRFGGGQVFWQFHWILELITWILAIVLLIGLVRWIWKKGDK